MSIESLASEPLYRLLLALLILLSGVLLYRGVNSLTLRRARVRVPGLERLRPGVPMLL